MTEVSNANESGNATATTTEKPAKKSKAKKSKAKKSAKKEETKSGGSAGRPKGVWSVLQAGALRPWRESNNISRGKLASMLKVSPTSIQNWESDKAIPSTKYQEAIVSLMSGNVPVTTNNVPKRGRPPKAASTTNANVVDMSGASSVGSIVTSYVSGIVTNYVQKNGKMSIDDLAKRLDSVRNAFAK